MKPGEKEAATSEGEANASPGATSPLALLNPGRSDRYQSFAAGPGRPGDPGHPPVNYHAYAAATGGAFHREVATIPPSVRVIVLLLRRDLKAAQKALRTLQKRGQRVWVALKEAGTHQVAELLNHRQRLMLLREIVAEADGTLASTPELVPFFWGAGARRVEFIPTPYPVENAEWDFSQPAQERRGIWIGTREWEVPSRGHLAALLSVASIAGEEPVSVMNPDGWRGRRRLQALPFAPGQLRIIEGRLPYGDYLRTMAKHRFVFQLDRSAVPGQVAGDALLCRLPCIGGDGAIERLAFPALCGHGRDAGELTALAARLLADPAFAAQQVAESQRLARERLGFERVAQQLGRLETL